jgi:hypothetical protein
MFGQILGSVVGGLFANNAAKKQAKAQDAATRLQMQGYTDARPYITNMYQGGTDALNAKLNAGYYGGPTYAGMNDMQTTGANNMYNFGNTAFGYGNTLMGQGANYGANFQNLYNQAGQDQIGNAINYADANAQPLVDAALRDSKRNLQENTLTSIGLGASGTGNTNSSRAGVAAAIAGRDYLDRAADTSAGIRDRLAKDYLNQSNVQFNNQMAANRALGQTFNTGFGMGSDAASMMTNAGGMFQKDLQNQYDDARNRFEGERDFASNAYADYNAQILGRAPQTPGTVTPNFTDPTAAGISGAMSGFGFGGKYIQPWLDKNFGATPQITPRGGASYWPTGPGYDPSF